MHPITKTIYERSAPTDISLRVENIKPCFIISNQRKKVERHIYLRGRRTTTKNIQNFLKFTALFSQLNTDKNIVIKATVFYNGLFQARESGLVIILYPGNARLEAKGK